MGYVSHTTANAALNGVAGDDTLIGSATLYIGLSSTEPTLSAGAFSGWTEPSTGGYARVAVTNNSTNWDVTDAVLSNLNDIEFPEATVNWNVDVSYYIVMTASSAGSCLWYGELVGAPVSIVTGNTPVFNPGQLTLNGA